MTQMLPKLGVGIGFRSPFRSDLFLNRRCVDFLEITTDHYLEASESKERELDLLRRHFQLVPHGLDLSLGSAEGLNWEYVEAVAGLIERIDPPWWSEHIAFTRAGGIEIGHLAPLPFTQEAVDVITRNVTDVRRHIHAPLILENITYSVAMPGAEMTEAEFLTEIVERTDCGLLLDVTNIYTNAVNQHSDPMAVIESLPMERVTQLHFAGGHREGDVLIDSHGHGTPEDVWTLLEDVLERTEVRGIILERDTNLPPFSELASEMERARNLMRRHNP